jgi:hypothetical protein
MLKHFPMHPDTYLFPHPPTQALNCSKGRELVHNVGFWVLTVTLMKMAVFWNVASFKMEAVTTSQKPVNIHQTIGAYCLHHQRDHPDNGDINNLSNVNQYLTRLHGTTSQKTAIDTCILRFL